jgi:hypothetical protein
MQLYRRHNAVAYLQERGLKDSEVIQHMRIGYAPGRCLRSWLTQLGYPLSALREAGLVNAGAYDTHRVVFPIENNLYGRSIWGAAPHLIQAPMAIVIFRGLLTSTALNMVVVPAAYYRFGRSFARALSKDSCTRSWPLAIWLGRICES